MSDFLNISFNGTIYNNDDNFEDIFKRFYNGTNLLEAVLEVVKLIDGDYAFSISDGENLVLACDYIGTKPLYYVDDQFSFYKGNLGYDGVKKLKPGFIIYNGKEIPVPPKEFELDESLEELLKESIFKRIKNLNEIPIIFSGGVDSSLIALILKEYPIKLYAVRKEGSKDLEYVKKVANSLNLPLKSKVVTEDIVKDALPDVLRVIAENNLMKIGVGMTIYLASQMISQDGYKVALSGQGADELFAGYNRYLKSYSNKTLQEELEFDIANIHHVNLERDYGVSALNNVELRMPYLDEKLVYYALKIPITEKINSSEDVLRKRVLRDLAFNLGLDKEFAYRPKKAAQYGTGIDKLLRKKVLKNFDVDNFINSL